MPSAGSNTGLNDDGMLKKELTRKDGRPEVTYVICSPEGKIAEVRSYYHGVFHGEWRTYNESGALIGMATYRDGQKDGPWRIWNEKGNLLFEMFYTRGRKCGIWRSWDEEGNLLPMLIGVHKLPLLVSNISLPATSSKLKNFQNQMCLTTFGVKGENDGNDRFRSAGTLEHLEPGPGLQGSLLRNQKFPKSGLL